MVLRARTASKERSASERLASPSAAGLPQGRRSSFRPRVRESTAAVAVYEALVGSHTSGCAAGGPKNFHLGESFERTRSLKG